MLKNTCSQTLSISTPLVCVCVCVPPTLSCMSNKLIESSNTEKYHRTKKGMQVSPGPYSFGLSGSPNLSPTSTKHPSLYQAQARSNGHVRIQLVQLPEPLHHHRSLPPSVVSMDLQQQTRNAHSRLDSIRCSEKNNDHLTLNSIRALPKFIYISS